MEIKKLARLVSCLLIGIYEIMIDQSASIHPDAKLDSDVKVGPFSIIEADVKIDKGTVIGPHVVIKSGTSIGKNNQIHQFSSVGEAPQSVGYKGEPTKLYIGDNNIIREFTTLNRGTTDDLGYTKLGNNNFIMSYVHLAHDCVVGDNVILANGVTMGGHVQVGDYAIMGGFALIHQFCRVGEHSIIGGGSICTKDIPPYILAAGNTAKPHGINVTGLKRRDFSAETISALRQSYRTIFRSKLDLNTAIEQLAKFEQFEEVNALAEFLQTSKRGFIR